MKIECDNSENPNVLADDSQVLGTDHDARAGISKGAAELHFEDFIATLQMLIREPAVVGTEDSFFRVALRVCHAESGSRATRGRRGKRLND